MACLPSLAQETLVNESQEIALVQGVLSREPASMRELYDRHIGYLATVCHRYILGEDDRKDILQESFIKIFSSIERFQYRGEGSLRAWMARIVVNEALGQLRKNKGFESVLPVEELPEPLVEDEDVDTIPEGVLLDMIASLPEGYRTVLNLYVFEERSHREIAQLLSIKESSSASQLHRAKSLLAQKIKEYKKQL